MAAILARRGATAEGIGKAIGVKLPVGPGSSALPGAAMIATGPGIWLTICEDMPPDWCAMLGQRLSGLASVSDQTAAYRVFRITGNAARLLLQRGVYLDLDDAAFPDGASAATMIGHVDVIIRRLGDDAEFEVFVYRSFAETFLRWFSATAAAL